MTQEFRPSPSGSAPAEPIPLATLKRLTAQRVKELRPPCRIAAAQCMASLINQINLRSFV